MALVTLTSGPAKLATTSTAIVQEAPEARLASSRRTCGPPKACRVPLQVVATFDSGAIQRPPGKLSTKDRWVKAIGFVVAIVNVRRLVPPTGTEAGANAFVKSTLDSTTTSA